MFKQRQDNQKATCPFNSNHVFAKEKFMFHINRCKDRQKVGHLYARCNYNSLHFVLKQDLERHELMCQDRDEVLQITSTMRRNYESTTRERERSREKNKEEPIKQMHGQEGQEDEHTLSECEECQSILQNLHIDDYPKLKKYLQMYEDVCKGEVKSK